MIEFERYLTRGFEALLKDLPIQSGKLRFTVDTGRIFLDINQSRIEFTDFVKDKTEEEILALVSPLPKIYISKDTFKFFYPMNGYMQSIADSVSMSEEAKHSLFSDQATEALKDGNGNQINTHYAPLASPIFTGTPTVPTPTEENGNQIANTQFVMSKIMEAVSEITSFETEIVNTFEDLPEVGVKGTIYYVPNTGEEHNYFDEYLWINGNYEKFGTTEINLSEYVNNIEVTGTGNAITNVTKNGNKVSFTKGATFLTQHPSVTNTSSTGTETPNPGAEIEMVDELSVDNNGHITNFRTKMVKLPDKIEWGNVANKPTTFTPSVHNHTVSQITDFPKSMPASDVPDWAKAESKPSYDWSEINNKPGQYEPGSHNHVVVDITDFPKSMPASDVPDWAKAGTKPTYKWDEINNKPTTFTPSTHSHKVADITDFPKSMPASDVKDWAKADSKPSYKWDEITGKPTTFTPSTHSHKVADITDFPSSMLSNGLEDGADMDFGTI